MNLKVVNKIDFAGDIFDRGNQPIELYFEILKHPNIQVIQGNYDVWLAREIMEKYAGEKVGEYISYNTLSIMEQRMTVVDLLNLATTVKRTPYGYKGIDDARVKILANAIEKYGGGDIVLSSDWKVLDRNHDDYRYLVSKLEQCGLKISDHTIDKERKRGQGVKEYLESHPEIEEFVILDDQKFDFEHYEKIWERLLITNGIERAEFASRTPAVEAILFRDYIKA